LVISEVQQLITPCPANPASSPHRAEPLHVIFRQKNEL